VTVYYSLTRGLIDNPQHVADKSSRADIGKNADGSYDLYFGPKAPAGHEKNWMPTIPGKAWLWWLPWQRRWFWRRRSPWWWRFPPLTFQCIRRPEICVRTALANPVSNAILHTTN
jgi:Protein of unknown function (DUF1214)